MAITENQAYRAFLKEVEHAVSLGYADITQGGWRMAFNRRKTAVGLCNYTKKTVELSRHFMATNTIEELTQTIKHEIAHALCPGDKHGAKWKRTFRALGGSGQRLNSTASAPAAIPKWALVDTTRDNEVVATYYSKPRRDPNRLQVRGRPETLGKLRLVKTNGVSVK